MQELKVSHGATSRHESNGFAAALRAGFAMRMHPLFQRSARDQRMSQRRRKGDEVDSLSGIPNRTCLPYFLGRSGPAVAIVSASPKLAQMRRLPFAAARPLMR